MVKSVFLWTFKSEIKIVNKEETNKSANKVSLFPPTETFIEAALKTKATVGAKIKEYFFPKMRKTSERINAPIRVVKEPKPAIIPKTRIIGK